MALPEFETNLNIIQQLDDEPNDVGGLSAAELKAKFDEAGLAIQTWINETLLPALIAANLAFAKTTDIPAETVQAAIESVKETSAAENKTLSNTVSSTAETLQEQITENYNTLHEELLQAVMGSIPDTSVTYRKLASDITLLITALQTGLSEAQAKIEELDGREIVIDPATQTEKGLMSAADKVKLDGIAAQATRVLVDNALSETSTNAIQNRAVRAALAELMQSVTQALAGKAPTVHTHVMANITDLTIDTTPTENSQNLVSSGGIYQAVKSAGDAAKEDVNAFKAIPMVHIGGVMAAVAHQGGHAVYAERVQVDAFQDTEQIAENGGVYQRGNKLLELLTTGLEGGEVYYNASTSKPNAYCNVSDLNRRTTIIQEWCKLFDFYPDAFGQLTNLKYQMSNVSSNGTAVLKLRILDSESGDVIQETAALSCTKNSYQDFPVNCLLDPNRRYSMYLWVESNTGTGMTMEKLTFTVTPLIYTTAAVTMTPLTLPAGAARLELLVHDAGAASSAALKFDSGEFAALTQVSAKPDRIPGGAAATLRRYTADIPAGAQTAQLKLTLNGSECKIYDYALIVI